MLPVDAAAPDAEPDPRATPRSRRLSAIGGFGREGEVALAIEGLEPVPHRRRQEIEAVIRRIGLEAGVHGRDDWRSDRARQRLRPRPEEIGAGNMDMGRREIAHVVAHRCRQAHGDPIFGAARQADRRHRNQIPGRREGRRLHRRRIDPDRGASLQQMPDELVERAVGAVANAIVIAREERDPKPFGRQSARAPTRHCRRRGHRPADRDGTCTPIARKSVHGQGSRHCRHRRQPPCRFVQPQDGAGPGKPQSGSAESGDRRDWRPAALQSGSRSGFAARTMARLSRADTRRRRRPVRHARI